MQTSIEITSSNLGKADLHIHSNFSLDALANISAILKRAKQRGLDVIAITDHDTIKGAREAQKMATELGTQVIIGEEVTTKEGDLIALFIQEKILAKRSALETIREIHRQGGLAIVPHPNNWLFNGISTRVLLKIFDNLDGIELFNGSWAGKINRKKNEKLNRAIFNLAPVGGSDAHLARQVGCAFTIFPGKTPADLYTSIKKKLTLPGGAAWDYKDRLLWLMNTPRIFYKYPKWPIKGALRVLKKIMIIKKGRK